MDIENGSLMKNATWEFVSQLTPTKQKGEHPHIAMGPGGEEKRKGGLVRFKAQLAIRGFLPKYGID